MIVLEVHPLLELCQKFCFGFFPFSELIVMFKCIVAGLNSLNSPLSLKFLVVAFGGVHSTSAVIESA